MEIENIDSLLGLKITGIINTSIKQELIVLFENNISLHFYDCIMYIDSGVINGTVKYIKEYTGEMGFVISLKGSNVDWDKYEFCYINIGEEEPFSQEKKIRIAYRNGTIVNNNY